MFVKKYLIIWPGEANAVARVAWRVWLGALSRRARAKKPRGDWGGTNAAF